jgi:fructose-1,6-bisphosphatase II / sedoheptulose-1,7-bisphosphatase
MPASEQVRVFARAKGGSPEDVCVCILERPRHAELIAEVRSTGASVRLISDADVAGVMHCARAEESGTDMYMGSGGAQQGVLGAAALKCMGGQMQGRLLYHNHYDVDLAHRVGIEDLEAKYNRDDMIRADVLFSATGVTDSVLLKGARRIGKYLETETLLMRSHTGSLRRLTYRTKDF